MVELHSSNFRVITTNILGVRIFRKFMVVDFEIEYKLSCCITPFDHLLIHKKVVGYLSSNSLEIKKSRLMTKPTK